MLSIRNQQRLNALESGLAELTASLNDMADRLERMNQLLDALQDNKPKRGRPRKDNGKVEAPAGLHEQVGQG